MLVLTLAIGLLAGVLAGYLVVRSERGSARRIAEQMKLATADAVQSATSQLTSMNSALREAESKQADEALQRRETEIRRLTDPIAKGLERIEREVTEFGKERKATDRATRALLEQMEGGVKGLEAQTSSLVKALRQPQTRGAWGEVQLRRCVEIAGMTEHVDFELQETIKGPDVWLRPDAVILLPAGRRVVVDSKVPLEAYLEALEAEEDADRRAELARHSRQAREHIRSLASKRYQDQFAAGETPDFVVCFFPSEAALHAAFEADPDLYAYALEESVLIATPTTLVGLLRTIELGWRQERIAAEAQQIADAARELHSRFGVYLGYVATLGKRLDGATSAYNEAIGSLDSRLLPQLRRVEDLGASSGKALPDSVPVEQAVRGIAAAELRKLEDSGAELRVLPEGDSDPAEAA